MLAIMDLPKRKYFSYLKSFRSEIQNLTNYPLIYHWKNFDTKLSMFGLAPSATEEGATGPQKGLKGPSALRRR